MWHNKYSSSFCLYISLLSVWCLDWQGGFMMATLTYSIVFLFHLTLSSVAASALTDYCDEEGFKIECGSGERILVTEALYGRMELGRCVTVDIGRCEVSVLGSMDNMCSGRAVCQVDTLTSKLFTEDIPCTKDFALYLQASHRCVPVLDASPVCHSLDRSLSLSRSPVYLLGKDAMALPCLNQQRRSMKVHASPGQLIKAGLIDFRPNTGNVGCVPYGDMIESKTRQRAPICGGQGRERDLMMSNSNELQIEWSPGVDNPHFMIKFEIIGCPNLAAPKHGWVKREDDESTIGCDHYKQKWHLRCVDNTWVGVVGNCSAGGSPQVTVVGEEEEEPFLPQDVMMTLIVAGSVVICLATITIGIVCWRRKHVEVQIEKMKVSLPRTTKGSRPESEYMMPSYPGGAPRDETEDALYDFCFTPGNAPANPSNVPNNMATAVTLPYRNNLNQSLMYNNTMLPPESGQYKTLIVVRPQ